MSEQELPVQTPAKELSIAKALLIGLLAIAAAIFLGLVSQNSSSARYGAAPAAPQPAGAPAQVDSATLYDVAKIERNEPLRGNKNADVIIVEYSDIDCPFCARVHPTIQNVVATRDDVAWAYRHLPLEQIHPQAFGKAVLAECVADQQDGEAYWTAIDAMFEGTSDVASLAALTGADVNSLNDCVASGKFDGKVREHMAGANRAGGTGTPFMIAYNTKTKAAEPIKGAVPEAAIIATIERLQQ